MIYSRGKNVIICPSDRKVVCKMTASFCPDPLLTRSVRASVRPFGVAFPIHKCFVNTYNS